MYLFINCLFLIIKLYLIHMKWIVLVIVLVIFFCLGVNTKFNNKIGEGQNHVHLGMNIQQGSTRKQNNLK